MRELRLTLPLPPSANRLVRPALLGARARLVKTKFAKDWLDAAGLVAAAQIPRGFVRLNGAIEWWATFYVARISRDCTNYTKQLEDMLSGLVWFDDLQVVEAHQKKQITEREERVVIEIGRCQGVDEETAKRINQSKKGKT